MRPDRESDGDYEIRSEPVDLPGEFLVHRFRVDQRGRRVFEAEVWVSELYSSASGARTRLEQQQAAEKLGRGWIRECLRRKSFIKGARLRVRYTTDRPAPTLEVLGRLGD